MDLCSHLFHRCCCSIAWVHRCGQGKIPSASNITFLTFFSQEKPTLFRRYMNLHLIVLLAAFALGAAWAITSAARHSTARSQCISQFFNTSDSAQNAEAQTLCQIFPWVDVGIMGGLWLVLAIMQVSIWCRATFSISVFLKDLPLHCPLLVQQWPAARSGQV